MKIIVKYAMPNPDLTMIDRMKDISTQQGLAWKKQIMKAEVKSFNII